MRDVVRSIEIQATPAEVWRWFTTAEALRRWVSPDIEIELRVGASFRLTGGDGETLITGEVLELVPERRLRLSWMEHPSDWVHPAWLAFELEPTEVGTHISVVHGGFEGIGSSRWKSVRDSYEIGADRHRLLERLDALVRAAA